MAYPIIAGVVLAIHYITYIHKSISQSLIALIAKNCIEYMQKF